MSKKETFHGSDVEKIELIYGIKKEDIIQFSGNVNPLGLSKMLKNHLKDHLDVLSSYPDRDYVKLRGSIGKYCNCDPNHVVVGNGSTELIRHMIQTINPSSSLVIAPTYSEYAREITLTGGTINYFQLKEEDSFRLDMMSLTTELEKKYDILVLCNPNNPTSSALTQTELKEILNQCERHHTYLMIDETYVEFASHMEEITAIPLCEDFDHLIVLRGVSKFYAAPGLRLGYAITSNEILLNALEIKKNPWSVNSIAEQAGIILFQDKDYIEETKVLIHGEQKRIYELLNSSTQFHPYPPHGNFILLKILDPTLRSTDYFIRAIKEGMMIRDCSDFMYLDDHYIRFCFLTPSENDRLIHCLLQK